MRLLVLGGTVFLSKAVAVTALARGHDVTVVARGESGEPPEGARFVKADRDSPDGLSALAGEHFDAVVDVARLPGQVKSALDTLAATTGHWTFVSSCSAYADEATPGQTVETGVLRDPVPDDSLDPDIEKYGASKVTCENLVLAAKPGRAFVVRAGLIVGNGDPSYRFGHWPDRIAEGGEVLAPGAPDELVQYVDVRDLAEWILDAAESDTTGVYDGISLPMTRADFLTQIAEGLDVSPRFTWVDQEFLQEHGVKPWSGEQSLGLWLPLPEYAGFLSRDTSTAIAAGLRIRPLAETARDWYATLDERPVPNAEGSRYKALTREKEAEILAAWHARD
ncbi:nucleoside-diphosphate-sugar epimerase [Stackebrandtia albiflava]|uniref:Nucleoside-diphosphate-sugar epimerase n=1 Tax=Stackebrandtia albiflava TaxID=406432 RepID=A0A562VEF0_9ACTN|nr:NAD-dependent epimerase/dehydratase family protein [Stackebrandtia albiflava]TWJ16266.1 nucleoside-diphosphate-sugar epimerase [Stackebrandtia albiflava]